MILSDRIQRVEPSATIAMAQKARALKEKGKDIISLTLGEPDFDTPENIKNAAKKALDNGITKYTPIPGNIELRKAIAHKLNIQNNIPAEVKNIVVSNGAKQSIMNAILCLINKDDEVIIPKPYWVSYPQMINMAGGKSVFIDTDVHSNFKITAQQFENAISDKTKLLIFSSPCNPSGSTYSEAELREFAKVIEKNPQLMVISDEIYEHITFEGNHFSLASIPSVLEQIITINGFSKGYAMTGWRLGYMCATEELAKACTTFQGQLSSGVNSFSQIAAIEALQGSQDPTKMMRKKYKERVNLLFDCLKVDVKIVLDKPEGAFYLFPDFSAYFGTKYNNFAINNSEDLSNYLLEDAMVATVMGSAFGMDNCLRMSCATSNELLIEAANRILKSLKKLK